MTLVHTEPEVPLTSRPVSRSWTDNQALGLTTYAYRIVAVAADGRQSVPSSLVQGRATDSAPPIAPTPAVAWTAVNGVVLATVTWTSQDESRLQERPTGAISWLDLGDWRTAGTYSVRDPFSDPTQSFDYRIIVRKYTGLRAFSSIVTLPPET